MALVAHCARAGITGDLSNDLVTVVAMHLNLVVRHGDIVAQGSDIDTTPGGMEGPSGHLESL